MPITNDDITWAYRMFLGREASADPAANGHLVLSDRDALRQAFIASAEFQTILAQDGPNKVGMHQEVTDLNIQTECSPEELDAMTSHIAKEWSIYGAEAPHWSVLTGDQFKPDQIEKNIELFYETGRHHAETMIAPLHRSGIAKKRFSRILDFGCGVGRLTHALAPIADKIVGADISPAHLDLARERSTAALDIEFTAIKTVADIDHLGEFDFIVSFMVLQHNPPPVMAKILNALLERLTPEGCIIVQIPTFIEGYEFNTQKYLQSPNAGIAANALPQHKIFSIIAEADCSVLEVRQDNFLVGNSLSHTFVAQKR